MPRYLINQLIAYVVGIVFGLGLMISGMTWRSKINAFLSIDNNWDPSLLIVLGVGVIINIFTFNYILHVKFKLINLENLHFLEMKLLKLKLLKLIGN